MDQLEQFSLRRTTPAPPRPGLLRTGAPGPRWHEGISVTRWSELDDDARQTLNRWFIDQVFPILTPLAVDPAHPFPYISGLSLNLAVVVRNPVSGKQLFARLKVPDTSCRA